LPGIEGLFGGEGGRHDPTLTTLFNASCRQTPGGSNQTDKAAAGLLFVGCCLVSVCISVLVVCVC